MSLSTPCCDDYVEPEYHREIGSYVAACSCGAKYAADADIDDEGCGVFCGVEPLREFIANQRGFADRAEQRGDGAAAKLYAGRASAAEGLVSP